MRTVVFRGKKFPIGTNLPLKTYANYSFVCGRCGDSWGKLEGGFQGGYIICCRPCENHGNSYSIGGSFLPQLAADFDPQRDRTKTLKYFGSELLLHEALMKAEAIINGFKDAR